MQVGCFLSEAREGFANLFSLEYDQWDILKFFGGVQWKKLDLLFDGVLKMNM